MSVANPPQYPQLSAGDVIAGRFELREQIGEGGMGAVWRARHLVTEGEVAIKSLGVRRDDVRERFLREARVIAALKHRHLVRVHDVIELPDGRPVMVMELLEGETLADVLEREGCLTVSEAARWMRCLADAVRHAHRHGVVHRDLKPDNIFIADEDGPERVPKLIDFGIAKVNEAFKHTGKLTKTGSVLGTPTYMAPEQVYGERDIDGRADCWALGMTMYEALTGVCPTEADNVGQVFKAFVKRDFRDLSEIRPDHPTELTNLVDRMLAADPGDRPSLDEVHATLLELERMYVAQGELEGSESTRPEPASRELVRAASTPDKNAARRKPRQRGMIVGAGIGVGLAAGALGFWLLVPATVDRLEPNGLSGGLAALDGASSDRAARDAAAGPNRLNEARLNEAGLNEARLNEAGLNGNRLGETDRRRVDGEGPSRRDEPPSTTTPKPRDGAPLVAPASETPTALSGTSSPRPNTGQAAVVAPKAPDASSPAPAGDPTPSPPKPGSFHADNPY
ncbi:MAG: protein kinase [Myxococcota bacterium]